MIFSKQLGSLGGRTAQDDIRYMANHIRRMQEELEYRLAHLDSQNITEIDMGQTKIYSGNVELLTMIKNGEQFSEIQQSVNKIALTVYGGVDENGNTVSGLNQLIVGEGGIQATVADLQTDMATVVCLDEKGLHIMGGEGNSVNEAVETLITGKLVASPKIVGGQFYDSRECGVLELALYADADEMPMLLFTATDDYTESLADKLSASMFVVTPLTKARDKITMGLGGKTIMTVYEQNGYTKVQTFGDWTFSGSADMKVTAVFA